MNLVGGVVGIMMTNPMMIFCTEVIINVARVTKNNATKAIDFTLTI